MDVTDFVAAIFSSIFFWKLTLLGVCRLHQLNARTWHDMFRNQVACFGLSGLGFGAPSLGGTKFVI